MGAAAIDCVVEFDRVAKTYDGRSRVIDDLIPDGFVQVSSEIPRTRCGLRLLAS